MKTIATTLCAVACGVLLAACAGAPPEQGKTVDQLLAEKKLRVVEEINQLVNFHIRGFLYVNRENVVLQDGQRDYLVELSGPCPNLEFANTIAFTSTMRVVRAFDRILVRDAPGRTESCIIKKLYRLEKIRD